MDFNFSCGVFPAFRGALILYVYISRLNKENWKFSFPWKVFGDITT